MAQPTPRDPAEESIDRILLEIRALSFVSPSDEAMIQRLRERILASHDEDIKHFVSAIEPVRPSRAWGQVLIGVGELLLASFLTIAGFVTIVPSVLGLESPGQVARYFGDVFLGLSAAGLSDPVLLSMSFAMAVFLLLAAFYTLRQAAPRLRPRGAAGHA